ncbi:MAG: hypothetical protein JWO78_1096 [Micavibrio sp.]|nr:hypothetical protein [Micavibrio sp.]
MADSSFLRRIFNRFPVQQAAYNRFAAMKPDERLAALREEARRTPRRIWLDLGIPPEKCETLSAHAHQMRAVADHVTGPHHDVHDLREVLKTWSLPLVIASELPLEEMAWDDRLKWRTAAAELAYGNCARTDNFRRINELYDPQGNLYEDEGVLASDIDYIVTARQALAYGRDYSHLAARLDHIILNCNAAILTAQGRSLWNGLVSGTTLAKPTNSASLQP